MKPTCCVLSHRGENITILVCFLYFYCNYKIQIYFQTSNLLNYTPILHETVFRMILIQMWTTRRSKDTFFFLFSFLTRDKTWMFTISLLFPPEMCDEKQQHRERVILQYTTDRYCATVKNNWEISFFFFSLLWNGFANIESTATGTLAAQDTEMHSARWGKQNKTKILESKQEQQHDVVRIVKSKSYKRQWDYRRQNY